MKCQSSLFFVVFVTILMLLGLGCEPTVHEPVAQTINYGSLVVKDLRCEYQDQALAIDNPQPRLSWQLRPVNRNLKNLTQSAYQILVATEPNRLTPELADLWNSARITSDQCTHIPYQGTALTSHQCCYWQVRVWDQDGMESPWSPMRQWRMGLLTPSDWANAQWITIAEDSFESNLEKRAFQIQDMDAPDMRQSFTSPLLRLNFYMSKPVKTALAYVAGLGVHELYLNGNKIGDHVLDPAPTNYDVHTFYVTHDISTALQPGQNAVGLWLGNGFYGQNIAYNPKLAYNSPRAKALLWIEYEDGTTETITTSPHWQSHYSPILFDNVYAGETYDARQEQSGWATADYRAGAWKNAKVVKGPTEQLRSQPLSPMRKIEVLIPKEIKAVADGRWIIDLGQNIAGWLRLMVKEKTDTQITIAYGEHLTPDGQRIDTASTGAFATGVVQQDIYICKGGDIETWEPRFTYQGFRYAEITGLTKPPMRETVQGILVHSDVAPRGSFSCSDPLLNQMVEVSKWTIVDNLHGLPEACPHREKCGWTGDAHLMAETALYHYDMARFFSKYLDDIKSTSAHTNSGQIPMVAPGKRLNGPATADWGAAIVLIPWYLHVFYGDEAILEQYYPQMRAWAQQEWTRVKEGHLEHGLGDAYPPLWNPETNPDAMECPPNVSATLLYLETLRILCDLASQQRDTAFSVWCKEKRGQLQRDFNHRYLQEISHTNAWSYGSQTADALALRYQIVPEDKQEAVVNGLQWDIEVRHKGHHACGALGLKHLYTALADHGQADLAFKVLNNPSFPSHAYTLGCGLTTWPERQFPMPEGKPYGDRSYNHAFHSGFATFFHEVVAGIRPDPKQPGFKHILMKPTPLGELAWAKAEHQSPYGRILSHWRINNHRFVWDIEVPVNCSATVYVPGTQVEAPDQATPVDMKEGRVVFKIGSGQYTFISK